MSEPIEFLSAVLIVTNDVDRLAGFYRDIVGIPLVEEEHGATDKHYGCELGDLHFAIHPSSNFQDCETGVGSVKLAFVVPVLTVTLWVVRVRQAFTRGKL